RCDSQESRATVRVRVGNHAPASGIRPLDARADRLSPIVAPDTVLPSRAMGRQGLSSEAERRRNSPRREDLLASDLPIAALPVAPAVGMGSDVVHAGLDDLREERSVNGAIAEHNLDPVWSHVLTSTQESRPLFNGPHVSLPAQSTCLHLSRHEGQESLTDLGSSN